MRASTAALLLALTLAVSPTRVFAEPYDERPAWQRAGYTTLAVVANVVPVASAVVVPKCLPGYILCKGAFAAISLITSGEQFLMSGGADIPQNRALLYRGFAGDWVVTGRQAAGDEPVEVLPEPAPVSSRSPAPPDGEPAP
jgi:hypothetical protein